MARSPKSYRVTIANTKQVVDCTPSQTILKPPSLPGSTIPMRVPAEIVEAVPAISTQATSHSCRAAMQPLVRSRSKPARLWLAAPALAPTRPSPG